jgi:predicted GNAT family acetyltransferase
VRWVVEPEPAAYAERVMPWLERDPARNTVPATILLGLLDGAYESSWLARLAGAGGAVAGVALRTPPRGVVLTALPPGAAAALAAVAEPGLPGAAGPAAEVEAFATAYAGRRGAAAAYGIRQRLYRLTEVSPPPPPPGRLREAAEADVELCAAWFTAFVTEAGVPSGGEDATAAARRVVGRGRVLLWDVGGMPVSMVCHTPPVVGVPRIAPVYTPPEHRRRGYAAAASAGLCGRLLDRGATAVVLFADRANPTATGVYERIGFEPVADWDDWQLEY